MVSYRNVLRIAPREIAMVDRGDFEETSTTSGVPGAIVDVDDATPPPPLCRLLGGTSIGGRYVAEEVMGEGTRGRTLLVRHRKLGKRFALRLIADGAASDAEARAAFFAEARVASSICHRGVVSVVDFGEDPRHGLYMVMELVDGAPLLPDGEPPPSIRRACHLLAQLADALDHLHRHGVVHGDVTLANVLVTTERIGGRRAEQIKLLDSGLAFAAGPARDPLGAPEYLAPERVGGAPPSAAGDVYGLGVVGYALLTGTLPFAGTRVAVLEAQLRAEPEPMSRRRGAPVDERLEALIRRAMAKDPGARHRDVAAFVYELKTVTEMLGHGRTRRVPPCLVHVDRDAEVVDAFDRSRLPQAHLDPDGVIVLANRAFAKLVGARGQDVEGQPLTATRLPDAVPGLVRDIRLAVTRGRPAERRVRIPRPSGPPIHLVAWVIPTGGGEVHLLVRAEDEPLADGGPS